MLSSAEYIQLSMIYNLFWVRIMKEHAIFIEASLPPTLNHVAQQAAYYRKQFSVLLAETVRLSGGIIPQNILQSGQFYTMYTEAAEQAVQHFTGIEADSDLTKLEYDIAPLSGMDLTPETEQSVSLLNTYILNMTAPLAAFQADLLESQEACRIATFLYTADIEHILREARRYVKILNELQSRDENYYQGYTEFWDTNMAQHAASMRGLFDPSESAFIQEANRYVTVFNALAQAPNISALNDTQDIAAFKATATQGMLSCKVKSIMNPLYTDHLLREANHYVWLMEG